MRIRKIVVRNYQIFLALLISSLGLGITGHDLLVHIIRDPVSTPFYLHGGYIGIVLVVVGIMILLKNFWREK